MPVFLHVFLLLLPIVLGARQVTISNVNPRLDVQGDVVNAHDGCLVEFDSVYFIYGTVYGHCHQAGPICDGKCGYLNNTFALYTSTDLISWTLFSNNILPEVGFDNYKISYWMPNVAKNPVTGLYVMTYWSGQYGFVNNQVAVAVSSTPYGPFEMMNPIAMSGAVVISDTVNFFVDDNGDGYIRYNTRDEPLRHVIELLNPDWSNTTGEYSVIFQKDDYPWYDGGGVFQRKGIYYVTIGVDCCFCQWGSDAAVFTATNPLGTWSYVSEANFCADGTLPAQHNLSMSTNPCSLSSFTGTNFTIPAQQFNFASITNSDRKTKTILYYGERFRSSPDGIKANDFQAWIPLQFEQDDVTIMPMKWLDNFTISIP